MFTFYFIRTLSVSTNGRSQWKQPNTYNTCLMFNGFNLDKTSLAKLHQLDLGSSGYTVSPPEGLSKGVCLGGVIGMLRGFALGFGAVCMPLIPNHFLVRLVAMVACPSDTSKSRLTVRSSVDGLGTRAYVSVPWRSLEATFRHKSVKNLSPSRRAQIVIKF